MDKRLIKQILLEQKREIPQIYNQKLIDRDSPIEEESVLNSKLIKIITGARRSGKSTMAHQLLKNRTYGYINFDDERLIGIKTETLNDCL